MNEKISFFGRNISPLSTKERGIKLRKPENQEELIEVIEEGLELSKNSTEISPDVKMELRLMLKEAKETPYDVSVVIEEDYEPLGCLGYVGGGLGGLALTSIGQMIYLGTTDLSDSSALGVLGGMVAGSLGIKILDTYLNSRHNKKNKNLREEKISTMPMYKTIEHVVEPKLNLTSGQWDVMEVLKDD